MNNRKKTIIYEASGASAKKYAYLPISGKLHCLDVLTFDDKKHPNDNIISNICLSAERLYIIKMEGTFSSFKVDAFKSFADNLHYFLRWAKTVEFDSINIIKEFFIGHSRIIPPQPIALYEAQHVLAMQFINAGSVTLIGDIEESW